MGFRRRWTTALKGSCHFFERRGGEGGFILSSRQVENKETRRLGNIFVMNKQILRTDIRRNVLQSVRRFYISGFH